MEYNISNMNLDIAKIISNWKYDGDYSIYNTKSYNELLESNSGLVNPEKKDNYICFWNNDNELIAYVNITKRPDNSVFIGIGLSPECCGKGKGKEILKYGIERAIEKYPYSKIKLQVRAWNIRAVKCYQSVGFTITDQKIEKDHDGIETNFIFMEYGA